VGVVSEAQIHLILTLRLSAGECYRQFKAEVSPITSRIEKEKPNINK